MTRPVPRRSRAVLIEPCEPRTLLAGDFALGLTLGAASAAAAYAVAADPSGNVVVAGSFTGKVDFDPARRKAFNLTSAGGRDIFVAKYTARGGFLWAVRAGAAQQDAATAVAVDRAGNVLVGGTFTERVDFDPGPGVFRHHAYSHLPDPFVWKLTPAGRFAWAAHGGGSTNEDITDIAVDAAGNAYVAGTGDQGGRFGRARIARDASGYVVKVSGANGFFLATTQFGGGGGATRITGVALDGAGNVFSAGQFRGTTDFDPGAGSTNLSAGRGGASFVAKVSAAGSLAWARVLPAGAAKDVTLDGAGNVVVAGSFGGGGGARGKSYDFDPGPGRLRLTSAGQTDAAITKLSSAGNLVWARRMGGPAADAANAVAAGPGGAVFATGAFAGAADFDPGPGRFALTSRQGAGSAFVAKLSAGGQFAFAKAIRVTSSDDDDHAAGQSIALTPAGDVLTTGQFTGTIDLDPGADTQARSSRSDRNADLYLSRLLA